MQVSTDKARLSEWRVGRHDHSRRWALRKSPPGASGTGQPLPQRPHHLSSMSTPSYIS